MNSDAETHESLNRPPHPALSIVVPMHNEADNVEALLEEISVAMSRTDCARVECLLVDDGSTDGTWQSICRCAELYPIVEGLRLSRNFGHQNALLAGLTCCKGDVIVTMDGDLQHPPGVIPRLLNAWRDGYDLINTQRVEPQRGNFKSLASRAFYHVFSKLADVNLDEGSSDFRLFDRKVLEPVLQFRDARMFFRGAFNWVGFSSTTIPYEVRSRHTGQTKYSLARMIRFAIDATVAFSSVPLRLSIALGFVTSFLAFLELVYVVALYFTGRTVPGWASTIGVLSLLFGILFIQLGIVGIYLSRIHEALQDRPRFIIRETVRSSEATRG